MDTVEGLRSYGRLLGTWNMTDPVQNRCRGGRVGGGGPDGSLSRLGGLDTLIGLNGCKKVFVTSRTSAHIETGTISHR